MKYELVVHKTVEKFLKKHPEIIDQFLDKFSQLRENPWTGDLDRKPMIGKEKVYRLRIGKYRFLYKIFEEKVYVFVYDADSRGQIYKRV